MSGFEEIVIVLVLAIIGPIFGSYLGVVRKPSDAFVFNMLAFAAGVMLAISFLELIPASIALSSILIALIGVVIGAVFMFGIESLVPKISDHLHLMDSSHKHGKINKKTPLFLMIGMFFHNFPEGMAIAIGFATNFTLTLTIAIAIAFHHIPEGISTSAPYYAITKNKRKAFMLASITALPTLIGFLFAYYLYQFIPMSAIGLISGITAGVMIYIAGEELIPASCARVTNHQTIFALLLGIIFVLFLQMFL